MSSLQGTLGALTFLFTDIEGSTRRWEADPADMGAALTRHDAILQAEITAASGTIFKHTGDGCVAVFTNAERAVDAAVAIQLAFVAEPLVLRIAMHSGAAEERDGDYFGPTLNRAARLLGAGHGGQVLVSDVTASLARGRLTDRVTLLDLGEHRLRDISEPERVHQVVAPGLGDEFPPLKSEQRSLGTLPMPRTSLIGRADAVAELVALVGEHRLVTLTGVGGTGKTRLSIAVADRIKDGLRDSACFVDLAPVADAEAVPRAVAEAVGMPLVAGQPVDEDLGRFLAKVEAVLVLDNCEHVLDEAADLTDLLLERAPELRILATSREALGVDGEHNWRVPSLATATDGSESVPPAAALFFDRADASGAPLDPVTELATVIEIAGRLDGIPLAIELAAARTAHLTPGQILQMLDDRFTLLGGGRRRARQRQATLQAAVDWSHDLLSEAEQQLLRRLAVFAGSFTIDAVAAVCCDGSPTAATGSLTSLVDKSLVVAIPGPAGMRYRMLETIRLYAQEKLAPADESIEYRDRHRDHFLAWSEVLVGSNPLPTTLHQRIEADAENIRAAVDWSLERDRPDLVVRQVTAAAFCWFQSVRSDEAEGWLAQTAERADPDLDRDQRIAWRGARILFAMEVSDRVALKRWVSETIAMGEGTASPWSAMAVALLPLFMTYLQPDDVAGNLALVEQARAHPGTQKWHTSVSCYIEAHVLLAGGRFGEAIAPCLRGRADADADPYWVTSCGALLLVARHLLGQHATAAAEANEILAEIPDMPGRYADLDEPTAASVAFAGAGDLDRARQLLRVQLATLARRYAHVHTAPGIPLVNTAVLLALGGQPERAAVVLGGIGRHGMQISSEGSFALFRAYGSRLQAELGDDAFLACVAESETVTVADLLAIAHDVAAG